MATTASFKQQCPSCEAWVPIRDSALIGRKICIVVTFHAPPGVHERHTPLSGKANYFRVTLGKSAP